MNKYKYTITLVFISLLLLLTTRCSFLDQDVYGEEKSFWSSEENVLSAVYGLYSFTREEGVTGRGVMWLENCSDNMITGRSNTSGDAIKNFEMTATNDRDVKDTFKEMYKIIARANAIIVNAPTVPNIDPVFLEEVLGEAYFMRGFAYLWIVPFYTDDNLNGGLPNITNETAIEAMDSPRPESALVNYDQIIADMKIAGEKLPLLSKRLQTTQKARPHKAAAWAFGARAALYASQYKDKTTQDKYRDMVISFCDQIIGLGGADARDLYDDNTDNAFGNLWTEKNNYSKEYLFSLAGDASAGPKFHGMSFQNGGWTQGYNTWGYFQPTYELLQAYQAGDIRRKATILLPGEKIMFVGIERHFGVDPENISSYSKMTYRKFMSPFEPLNCKGTTVNSNTNDSSNVLGTCLMRFADVLLMKAEALIWKNGEGDAEAKKLLNRIKKRARLAENSTATKAELKNERRCELASELQPSRHLDLVRWGDAQSIYAQPLYGVDFTVHADKSVTMTKSAKTVWPARTFDPGKHHVFPIPDAAIQSAVNLKQNVGY